jgi:hypothetical protein
MTAGSASSRVRVLVPEYSVLAGGGFVNQTVVFGRLPGWFDCLGKSCRSNDLGSRALAW